jgi:hypothetical protein
MFKTNSLQLASEEFKQLHEHIREYERSIGQLTIVMITASAALLSAIGLFYFRLRSFEDVETNVAFSYLFLSPAIVVMPLMATIKAHRTSLYKIGLYIKVFFEGEYGGAFWHRRLEKYQEHAKGESQDKVPYFSWVITFISYAFFFFSLAQLPHVNQIHYFAPIMLVPLLIFQHINHNEMKDIKKIESVWVKVKNAERTTMN